MKTTVDLDDAVLHRLREKAAAERTTMRELLGAALRQFLSPQTRARKFKLRDASFRGTGTAPGIREGDWEQIRDIAYEGRGGLADRRPSRKTG